MPFAGVELPENLGSTPSGEAPAPEQKVSETQGTEITGSPEGSKDLDNPKGTETTAKTAQEILDLDKLERVRWGGKEWTIKDLQNATLRQEDYSKKTAEIRREKEYASNFHSDLQTLLRSPERLDEFKRIYSKEWVDLAERIIEARQQGAPKKEVSPEAPKSSDPRTEEMYREWQDWKRQQYQTEVEKQEAWLDNQMDTLSKKYDFADRETVLARAQVITDQGNKLTDTVLERLFKEHHESTKARWDKQYQAMNSKQKAKSEAGKDVGPGGAIPGQAPVAPKSMKEARIGLFNKFD